MDSKEHRKQVQDEVPLDAGQEAQTSASERQDQVTEPYYLYASERYSIPVEYAMYLESIEQYDDGAYGRAFKEGRAAGVYGSEFSRADCLKQYTEFGLQYAERLADIFEIGYAIGYAERDYAKEGAADGWIRLEGFAGKLSRREYDSGECLR